MGLAQMTLLPFVPTPSEVDRATLRFPPVVATQRVVTTASVRNTSVKIVAVQDYAIGLVATFLPKTPVPPYGQRLVAGAQTVDTTIFIDFNLNLPLWWFAGVLNTGEIAANTAVFAYTADTDSFSLHLNKAITLTHDATGWHIPVYDGSLYTVSVGFGVGQSLVVCAYAVPGSPNTNIVVGASGYQFALSNGGDQLGAVILADQTAWTMPLGGAYLLTFDTSGNGHLTNR